MVRNASRRARAIGRSPFFETMELVSKHESPIYLSLGQPDFVTPGHIIDAAKTALDEGFTGYTADKGMAALRQKVAERIRAEHGLDIDPEKGVIITIGGVGAGYVTILATTDPGDEVLLPCPYWPAHNSGSLIAGCIPKYVMLREELDFMPDPEEVEAEVTERTRLMIINSPSNPTGSVFSRECLKALSEIAVRHDLFVLSDEVYERLVYDGARHYSIATFPGMAERTVIVNSFSKAYAMTGWRVGYAAGDSRIISQMLKAHEPINCCAPSISQRAALAALTGSDEHVRRMLKEYDVRRRAIVKGLNEVPGVSCRMPKGAFYAFPNVEAFGKASLEISRYLATEVGVAVTPGSSFGPYGEGHLRISYASSMESLMEGVRRMKMAFGKLLR
ncbi:MAG: pyridoxal phosphate-dependent aminotransferase [Candidatus Bathyarchaeia archaeon]